MSRYLHVDLCCGLGGWQQPFRESDSWRTVGFDVDRGVSPDAVADVRQLPLGDCKPTLVTASPPCIEVAKYNMPWYYDGAKDGPVDLELFEACFDAIERLDPDWWVLENVQGLHDFYGWPDRQVGPFWLWGDIPTFHPDISDRKPKHHYWGGYDDTSNQRAKVPYELADTLRRAVEWHETHSYWPKH